MIDYAQLALQWHLRILFEYKYIRTSLSGTNGQDARGPCNVSEKLPPLAPGACGCALANATLDYCIDPFDLLIRARIERGGDAVRYPTHAAICRKLPLVF